MRAPARKCPVRESVVCVCVLCANLYALACAGLGRLGVELVIPLILVK